MWFSERAREGRGRGGGCRKVGPKTTYGGSRPKVKQVLHHGLTSKQTCKDGSRQRIRSTFASKRKPSLKPSLWSHLPNDLARRILMQAVSLNKKEKLEKLATKLLKAYAAKARQYRAIRRKLSRDAYQIGVDNWIEVNERRERMREQRDELFDAVMSNSKKFLAVVHEMSDARMSVRYLKQILPIMSTVSTI